MVADPRQLTVEQALTRAKHAARKGDEPQALALYQAVLQQHPDHPVAKKACRKLQKEIRRKHPPQQQIDALIGQYHEGQMVAVERSCRELLKRFPRSLILINLLGAALQVLGKLNESVALYDRAILLQPGFAEAHSNRGNALKDLGRSDAAIASYDRAIALNPDYAVAYLNRGNTYKDIGREALAASSYEKAIAVRPDFAEAHRSLSTVKTYAAGDAQIASMEKLLDDSQTPEADQSRIRFALAKACDDLGDYDSCFEHLRIGNALRKKELRYDLDDDSRLFAGIRELFGKEDPDVNAVAGEHVAVKPLFIVGMMRSGTSLVEQILASHSGVYGAGELELLNHLVNGVLPEKNLREGKVALTAVQISEVRDAYFDMLTALNVSEGVVTDKMPTNFRWIGFILSAFRAAKIVHVRRDPVATCWSIYKHYFPVAGNGYAYDMQDLAAYYKLYEELMTLWHARYPDSIYELCYEDLTENQVEESRRLLEFCELDWEDRVLDFHETQRPVRTQSAGQVRREMYQGSSEAWRHYEKHLQPLIKGLE